MMQEDNPRGEDNGLRMVDNGQKASYIGRVDLLAR